MKEKLSERGEIEREREIDFCSRQTEVFSFHSSLEPSTFACSKQSLACSPASSRPPPLQLDASPPRRGGSSRCLSIAVRPCSQCPSRSSRETGKRKTAAAAIDEPRPRPRPLPTTSAPPKRPCARRSWRRSRRSPTRRWPGRVREKERERAERASFSFLLARSPRTPHTKKTSPTRRRDRPRRPRLSYLEESEQGGRVPRGAETQGGRHGAAREGGARGRRRRSRRGGGRRRRWRRQSRKQRRLRPRCLEGEPKAPIRPYRRGRPAGDVSGAPR